MEKAEAFFSSFLYRYWRNGTVRCSAEGNGCSVRAQFLIVIYMKWSGTGAGSGRVQPLRVLVDISCSHFISFPPCDGSNSWPLSRYPQWLHRTPLWALSGFLPCLPPVVKGKSLPWTVIYSHRKKSHYWYLDTDLLLCFPCGFERLLHQTLLTQKKHRVPPNRYLLALFK